MADVDGSLMIEVAEGCLICSLAKTELRVKIVGPWAQKVKADELKVVAAENRRQAPFGLLPLGLLNSLAFV